MKTFQRIFMTAVFSLPLFVSARSIQPGVFLHHNAGQGLSDRKALLYTSQKNELSKQVSNKPPFPGAIDVNVNFIPENDSQSIGSIYLITTGDDYISDMMAMDFGDGYFLIPKDGRHDILVVVDTDFAEYIIDNNTYSFPQGVAYMYYPDVEITDPLELVIDMHDAVYETAVEVEDPQGRPLVTNNSEGIPVNCNAISISGIFNIRGRDIEPQGNGMYTDLSGIWSNVRTNVVSDDFKIRLNQTHLTDAGIMHSLLPLDFSKDKNIIDKNGWCSASVNVGITPMYGKWLDYDKDNTYAIGYYTLLNGNLPLSGGGIGSEGYFKCDTGSIHIWEPEESDLHIIAMPMGNSMKGPESSIIGLPWRKVGKELKQIGYSQSFLNVSFCNMTATALSNEMTDGNPLFYGDIPATIGNSCPSMIVNTNNGSDFIIDYVGREGESYALDACDLADPMAGRFTENEIKMLGGNACDLRVYRDDQVIHKGSAGVRSVDWSIAGTYKVKSFMKNVKIDESIDGCNSTEMEWSSESGKGVPTVTALRFRDKKGVHTDRFENSDGIAVEIMAAEFFNAFEPDKWWYTGTNEVESVEAEWSPMGKEEWSSIEMTEDPDKFYMPGYGYYFKGEIDAMTAASENKWYDLRIKVTDPYGAWQQQVISPAFRVESIGQGGVSGIRDDEGDVEIWTIDGTRIERNPESLGAGIYLIRKGTATTKRVVR